jgi:AcrR family transcriptional regulator
LPAKEVVALTRTSAEDRRDEFVEAAIKVMALEGLDHATTRRIAEEAGAPQGVFHYVFHSKEELLKEVVAAVTTQVGQVVHDTIDPRKGLAAAIRDAVMTFWKHVMSDDGLQLMQYELMIHSLRTPGLNWLAEWQYTRYVAVAAEAFGNAAKHDPSGCAIDINELSRFVVAALDGLVIQYVVHHDDEQSHRDVRNLIAAAIALAGLEPSD